MKTGAELKARREELKIKQQDLADQLGISRTQLSRMENGLREADESIIEKWKDVLFGLKLSDLEVGDYVYVRDDLVEFKDYGCTHYVDEICSGIQQIESFHSEDSLFITNKSHYWVTPEMLDLSRSMKKEDYLKMKEVKSNESFYELQEVAFQAYKDGLINNVAFENKLAPSLIRIDGNVIFDQHVSYKHDIDRIKSLYTEEFVIETMADELKIKSGAQLILSNGMKCIYFDDGDRKLRHDDDFYPCNFLVLKGATVKQSKGTK